MKNVKTLTVSALIAAMYCALTLALPFMTFGPVQCRLSEALTILPVFTPAAVPGLMVGCLVSNTVGLATGANVAGGWDILIGTVATGAAALCTRGLRNVKWGRFPVLATLPPVLFNALLIGGELTWVLYGGLYWDILTMNILWVGLGQLIACVGGGLLLFLAVDKTPRLQSYLGEK